VDQINLNKDIGLYLLFALTSFEQLTFITQVSQHQLCPNGFFSMRFNLTKSSVHYL